MAIDLDGPENIETLRAVAAPHGGMPETLTARTGRGFHLYYAVGQGADGLRGSKTVQGILIRGEGGYTILPPSQHHSGRKYEWIKAVTPVPLPAWFEDWLKAPSGTKISGPGLDLKSLPDHLVKRKQELLAALGESRLAELSKGLRLEPETWSAVEEARIRSALGALPASCDRDTWLSVGMALHSLEWVGFGAQGGADDFEGDRGFGLWAEWSRTGGPKFQGMHDLETRWRSFRRSGVTLGTLFHLCREAGWREGAANSDNFRQFPTAAPDAAEVNGHTLPASFTAPMGDSAENPLIRLNEKYAVIGDVGGKCLVMGWTPSKVDDALIVPSFQSFKSFAERHAHRYVTIKSVGKNGETVEDAKQLGSHWLKWGRRRSYEGIDLVPGGPALLANGQLNLWSGFAVPAAPGDWSLMRAHVADILAGGDPEAAEYIFRFAAWAVQNPGERAEAALVFRGGKGSGKGTFANALKKLFGQHGLQIFNSKHLVGAFNGHLRNCLLLFADEAFWAGDKQGESVLKGLLTEPALMIEQKGIDAAPWRNRLHVIMAANAEWVVPASHDERRYAMFDVSGERIGDQQYFEALHAELGAGGLGAMLHDLLKVDLAGWHPRKVVQTEALRFQKERSLDPLHAWWEGLLQDGYLPFQEPNLPNKAKAETILHNLQGAVGMVREANRIALGRFLRKQNCEGLHERGGNSWRFPALKLARSKWEYRNNGWQWREEIADWRLPPDPAPQNER